MIGPLITAKEAAAIMGVSVRTVYERAAPRGPLTCYRFGGALRFDREDVDAYLQACRCEPVDLVKSAGEVRRPMPTVTLKASSPGEESPLLQYFREKGIDVDKVNARRIAKDAARKKEKNR